MLGKCVCGDFRVPAAEFQNKKYGYGVRVMNECKSSHGVAGRCTVCGTKKEVSVKVASTK